MGSSPPRADRFYNLVKATPSFSHQTKHVTLVTAWPIVRIRRDLVDFERPNEIQLLTMWLPEDPCCVCVR